MSSSASDVSFSVILPTKDRPQDLQNALRSLAVQTHENFEVVVVNDGIGDVRKIIDDSPLSQSSIPVQHCWDECETGPSAARNRGIELARCDVLAYLDDDFFKPNHLEVHAKEYLQQAASVVYSDAERCRITPASSGEVAVETEVVLSRDFDPDSLMVSNYIPMLSLSHRRECLNRSGWFEESLSSLVDWDLFLRLSQHYEFCHVPEVTAVYVEKNRGDSVQERNRDRFLQNLDTVYERSNCFLKDNPAQRERVWNMRLSHVANIMYETGVHFEQTGDLADALDAYARAARTNAQPEYYLAQARVQKALGKHREALITMHMARDCHTQDA